MKSQGIKTGLRKNPFPLEKGFALIAAVTLMLLLALISVALMTLASSVSRSSGRGKLAEEARAQARLALQIALGRMQTEIGPDQRITANSAILANQSDDESTQGVSSPYILGVWNSWDSWLNRANSKGSHIADTYTPGRASQFRRWLISSPDENTVKNWNAVTGSGQLGQGNSSDRTKVLLLGQGTLGNAVNGKEVYGGLVEVDNTPIKTDDNSRKTNRNYIAYWVSGENLKARINLPKYKRDVTSPSDVLAQSWDTPTPDSDVIPGLTSLSNNLPSPFSEEYDEKIRSIFTRGTLRLAMGSRGRNQGDEYFHEASFDSVGLITDVKFGGLKKDLNILLSQQTLQSTDFYETNTSDVGLRGYGAEDASGNISISARPISSWKQLYYWYNLWDKETKQGQDDTSPLAWSGQTASTRIASDPETGGVMNNRYTYLRQPILLKMYVFTGFGLIPHASTTGGAAISGMDGQMGSRPVWVWWNPYNVPLDIGYSNHYLAGFGSPHRILPVSAKLNSMGATLVDLHEHQFSPHVVSYTSRGLFDYGTLFRKTIKEKTFSFAPGEIKVFTHELANNTEVGKDAGGSMVLQRSGDIDKKFDAYTITNQFADYEPTFVSTDSAGNAFVVPLWTRYCINVDAYLDWKTPTNFDEKGYGAWLALAPDYNSLSKTGGTPNNFYEESMYRLFLRKTSSDNTINFAVGFGLTPQTIPTSTSDLSQGKAIEKYFPSFFNINWLDERPFIMAQDLKLDSTMFYLQWPNWQSNANPGQTDPQQNTFWISYYGISAKGAHGPIDANSRYPVNSDQRAKTWQHSPAFFWGSQMPNPTDILRQNHPYQFEVRKRLDNRDYTQMKLLGGEILGQIDKDQEGGAYFGHSDEDMVSTIVATELPLFPPFSLAGFSSFRLTPGWFDDGQIQNVMSLEGKRAKRIAYQSGVPGIGIGNSFADPMIKGADIFFNYTEQDSNLADYWDHGFLVNDALWDTWFTSSISKRPSSLGGSSAALAETAKGFVSNAFSARPQAEQMLPNRRFQLEKGLSDESTITQAISSDGGSDKSWEKSARYLTIPGAFNLNSTSVNAWTAVLNSLKERKVVHTDFKATAPSVLSGSGSGDSIYFTRFGIASSPESRYGLPMHRIEIGNNKYSWSDLRSIKAASGGGGGGEVRELARQIVIQIKKRGPFLSMSEFINRRLSTETELGTVGALQAAIDNTGLNSYFETNMMLDPYTKYNFPAASAGSVQTAAPGYLIQSDVLAALGNTLTVRDDTFTVRAYGQICDPSGTKIEGRAWCEAVVQRTLDYVDPINDPEIPARIADPQSGDLKDSALSETNKAFGRKLKIVSFRWLSPEEV